MGELVSGTDALKQSDSTSETGWPPGATDANWFGFFNNVAFQIPLGAPAILYAKSQGATATIIGIMAALTPLSVIFQLPAAHLLPKYGYRRFILAGWGSRTLMVLGMAAVPILSVGAPVRLALLLLCLFLWNLVRGVTQGAWWPWLAELIPDHLRGRFLSRDQIFGQCGALLSLTVASIVLGGDAHPWQFALAFLFSAAAQTASLLFLKRMPDITAADRIKKSSHRIPWKQMLAWPPFARLVIYNLGWVIATGGLGAFTVAFLKSVGHYSDSRILILTLMAVVGALMIAPFVGRFVDREGSRLVLRLCNVTFMLIFAGWWLLASGAVQNIAVAVVILNLLTGAAGSSYTVANWRFTMATMPVMGRNHFFAMYTVFTSLGLGFAPILWGAGQDALHALHRTVGPFDWNRYTVYFAAAFLVMVASLMYSARLVEATNESRP